MFTEIHPDVVVSLQTLSSVPGSRTLTDDGIVYSINVDTRAIEDSVRCGEGDQSESEDLGVAARIAG